MSKKGRPKNPPKAKVLLKDILPVEDMFDEDELLIYNSLVDIYLKDFDSDDLTSSDIDDIMTLATNKVLEVRLMKASKGDALKHLDYSNSLEKLRKQSDKIKDNLSSRRKDRVDPSKAFKGFSIVDIAVAFDSDKRKEVERKAMKLKKNQEEIAKKLSEYGNRNDVDEVSNG
jgi:hypothetical protein